MKIKRLLPRDPAYIRADGLVFPIPIGAAPGYRGLSVAGASIPYAYASMCICVCTLPSSYRRPSSLRASIESNTHQMIQKLGREAPSNTTYTYIKIYMSKSAKASQFLCHETGKNFFLQHTSWTCFFLIFMPYIIRENS